MRKNQFLGLSILFCLTALTACGTKPGPKSSSSHQQDTSTSRTDTSTSTTSKTSTSAPSPTSTSMPGPTSSSSRSDTSTSKAPTPPGIDVNLPKDYAANLKLLIPNEIVEINMMNSFLASFKEAYPNININVQKAIKSVDEWNSYILTLKISGNLPDLIWQNSPTFYGMVGENIALDLSPYYQASVDAKQFRNADFYTEFLNMGQVDGNQYLIPRSADSVITFYNPVLLEEAGIDLSVIKDGWTFDTFLSVCEQYRAYQISKGWNTRNVVDMNVGWDAVCYPILKSFGADVLDSNGNNIIKSDATKKALNFVRDMYNKGYIVQAGYSASSSFENGTTPFLFQSANALKFKDYKQIERYDLVSFPLIQENSTPRIGCGIAGYSITKSANDKNACWAFMKHLLSVDGQNALADGGNKVCPIRKDLAMSDDAAWKEGCEDYNLDAYSYGPSFKQSTDFVQYADSALSADLIAEVGTMFGNATRVSKTIDNILNNASDNIDYILFDI